nr:TetR/AcrR family transcriptional regulator [Meiothermus sp. CFH 77666]
MLHFVAVTVEARTAPKREVILEATIRVLRDRGLSGLKVEEVAREAEVGKGTVYLYFQDKQDLLKALVEHHTFSYYRKVEEVVNRSGSFRDRLAEVLRLRIDWVEEWRGLWAAVAREAHPVDTADWLKGMHEHYQHLLEKLVQDGKARGEVRAELDTSLTAASIAALACNPQLEFPREAYLEHLLGVLLKGVAL